MKKRCLVTGGGGFIGYHLIKALLKQGFNVRCLDLRCPKWLPDCVEFVEGDFTASHLAADCLEGCDVVFHMACTTLPKSSNLDPEFDVMSNVVGTLRLLELSVKHKVNRFIYTSSGGTVYGVPETLPIKETDKTNPTCSYGITKLTIEKYLRFYSDFHGLNTCSIRLSNPFGEFQRVDSGQGAISVFCHKAVHGEPIEIWGDGSISRDFIYISDVIDALIRLIDNELSGLEINIGSGRATSLNEILDIIESILNRKIGRKYEPGRTFDVPISLLDISLALRTIGWAPQVDLKEGVIRTLNWMKGV